MQISSGKKHCEKMTSKVDLGRSWAPFGSGLGRSGTSLRCSWAPLGRFWAPPGPSEVWCFSKMVPWRAPGSILEPAGPILEASSHDFGGSGRALGLIFCMIFDRKRCNDLYLFCKWVSSRTPLYSTLSASKDTCLGSHGCGALFEAVSIGLILILPSP